ncbi:ABC transporter ATP-binding protein [Guggenheimella bovis]
MLRHFKPFLKKSGWRYLIGIVVLLIVDLLQLIVPQLLKQFTDSLLQSQTSMSDVTRYTLIVLALALGMSVGRFLWRVLIVWTALNFETWIRGSLFSHLVKMPRSFYNRNKTGDLMAHATNDISTVRQAFSGGIIMSVDALFITITTIGIMITSISPSLTFLALSPMPLIAIFVFFMGKIIQRKYRDVQEGFSILSDKAQESFAGIRVIKSFAQEEKNLEDFNEKNQLNYDRSVSLAKSISLLHPIVKLIGMASSVLGIAFGAKYVLDGTISTGSFVAFLNYLDILVWPMMALGFFTNMIQRGIASIERLNVLFDEKSDLRDSRCVERPKDLTIRFKDFNFSYPGEERLALEGINLTIPEGSSLGILGRTGSGKSTLASILLRLYNVDRGKVFIGEKDLNDICIHDTREMVGAVVQDHFLFSKRIQDNIALSSEEVDFEEVQKNAKISMVHDEIMGFPKGYETYLGERGVNLSGGQKQRTSIARLLYKDPEIIILDDALSAVDTKTEDRILTHLQTELGNKTTIVIAHRVSTLQKLDQIIFLEDGKIVERGTHEELLALQGRYAQVWKKQQLEDKIRGN